MLFNKKIEFTGQDEDKLGVTRDIISCSRCKKIIIQYQESRADAGVSARQSRHLAINFELGFLGSY